MVNWKTIANWRKAVEDGQAITRAPPRTGCQRCQSKRHSCMLPATNDLRRVKRAKMSGTAQTKTKAPDERSRAVGAILQLLERREELMKKMARDLRVFSRENATPTALGGCWSPGITLRLVTSRASRRPSSSPSMDSDGPRCTRLTDVGDRWPNLMITERHHADT